MELWRKLMYPMRSVWIRVATRLGIRKTGLLKLRHDVRACEYKDIHVMWGMLERNDSVFASPEKGKKRRNYWKLFRWARCAPCICRS
ncbi:elongation factor [Senna tora]|uniref:Elongation factor n=1 Tax=Senna tora TaxID=362788 RepID=A0A834TEQ9_9FABA|nr:elongation factor [Senna tora]